MSDQGMLRNLQAIFGMGEVFEGMGGKPLRAVTLNEEKDRITFSFQDGTEAVLGVEGDCCSRSWIEHLTVPDDIVGQELIEVLDEHISREENPEDDCLQVYQTKMRTAKGDIILEYRNASNGYYGGSLVRLA